MIENTLAVIPGRMTASFYRTAAGAEIDLILQFPGGEFWAIEVKSSLAPKLKKGFYNALEDIKPDRSFVVYAGSARYPVSKETEVISLFELSQALTTLRCSTVHNRAALIHAKLTQHGCALLAAIVFQGDCVPPQRHGRLEAPPRIPLKYQSSAQGEAIWHSA